MRRPQRATRNFHAREAAETQEQADIDLLRAIERINNRGELATADAVGTECGRSYNWAYQRLTDMLARGVVQRTQPRKAGARKQKHVYYVSDAGDHLIEQAEAKRRALEAPPPPSGMTEAEADQAIRELMEEVKPR